MSLANQHNGSPKLSHIHLIVGADMPSLCEVGSSSLFVSQFKPYSRPAYEKVGAPSIDMNGLGIVRDCSLLLTQLEMHVPAIVVSVDIAGIIFQSLVEIVQRTLKVTILHFHQTTLNAEASVVGMCGNLLVQLLQLQAFRLFEVSLSGAFIQMGAGHTAKVIGRRIIWIKANRFVVMRDSLRIVTLCSQP